MKSYCEPVDLKVGTVLCQAGQPFRYAYFPIVGTISLTETLAGHEPLETDSIGNEGMLGSALVLNIKHAPQTAVVQTPLQALRFRAKQMPTALRSLPSLLGALQRYLYASMVEQSQTTGCIHFHEVARRLAKALLLAQDRANSNHLPLTHQHLADTLGVRRSAVTIAAIKLQRDGIIRYSRGKISILDRERLENSSCRCYQASVENYAKALL
ncbi:Crp/Fnr family transcriptional regulator [Marinimicrobium locisalis]|uniref:Crp/Fnr family transcriptional regulator n=1 Tax=Marinimicrobium locisalis TaxID=546022 RepID=UPI003222111E